MTIMKRSGNIALLQPPSNSSNSSNSNDTTDYCRVDHNINNISCFDYYYFLIIIIIIIISFFSLRVRIVNHDDVICDFIGLNFHWFELVLTKCNMNTT